MKNENRSYNTSQIHVMIVDDHIPIRKALRAILSKMGIKEVVEFSDVDEALKELRQYINLIFLDIYLQKGDGFEVLSHVRNRGAGSDIPIIVVSGDTSRETIIKASDLGANDYIVKPFQPEAMETKIHQILNSFFSPSPVVQILRQGDKYFISKDLDNALDNYKKALSLDPDSMRAKHSIALVLDEKGKTEEAVELLKKNIAESPKYYKNHASLTDIYMRQGNKEIATATLKKELEVNPKQSNRQALLGKLLAGSNDFQGAFQAFRAAIRENSKNAEALLGAAEACLRLDDLEKAIYYLKKYRRALPHDSTPLRTAIRWCLDKEEPRRAELMLKEEIRNNPSRIDSYILLSKMFINIKKYTDAEKTLKDLNRIDRGNAEGQRLMATLAIKENDFERALSILDPVAKREPSLEILVLMAECLLKLNKIEDCVTTLHRAMSFDQKDPSIFFLLGKAYETSQEFLKSALCFLKAADHGADRKEAEKYSKENLQSFLSRRRKIPSTRSA
ncbi:MAG: tetratricopeptide repeat protein [Deltaproteobacteria bacterium]|nr:tetratricopeptide repeat protein [Deltaproteobacteria bacterium]